MPRGMKCRNVCFEPENTLFLPENGTVESITITLEEFEAIRLVDREGFDQSTASEQMNISRGTFQRILYAARYKIADALTEGYAIQIQGGSYQLSGECTKRNSCCKKCISNYRKQ